MRTITYYGIMYLYFERCGHMRVKISRSSKGAESYSIIKDVYINNKKTTKVVMSLGNKQFIEDQNPGVDALEWATAYAKQLTLQEKQDVDIVIERFNSNRLIPLGVQNKFNCGYLFLQSIYHQLKLDKLCQSLQSSYKFTFDLNELLSIMCFQRILNPSSKKSDFHNSSSLLEHKEEKVELHQFYRALEVIAKEADLIEEHVYNSSLTIVDRNTKILFYDCTNFFFEIDEAEDDKQYGKSKENRPNPIIQMGLFMDGSGLPLAFTLFGGNQNEQGSMKPLEQRIIKDFELSEFVICTDAGLSSQANRKFNNIGNRKFITTQSIKKLKKHLKDYALNPNDWEYVENGRVKRTNLDDIVIENNDRIYYKERWINEDGLEQRLFISFSPKHKLYQQSIRDQQVQRVLKKVKQPSSIKRKNPNDSTRFIKEIASTVDGEVASDITYSIDNDKIKEEAIYDGFYGICTNVESTAQELININRRRWEIEETFRIMKSEFKARPVYLKKKDRIKAHFTICFLSLLILRILEKKLEEKYSYVQIISKLQEMELVSHNEGIGYKPAYVRDGLTDHLHQLFNFRTDTEIITNRQIKEIFKKTKLKK